MEVGAVKLKDGLFFGDSSAAQDVEFVMANKVSRIVNCASRQVFNQFELAGIEYLSFKWEDNDIQEILDGQDRVVNHVTQFIDEVLVKGESVLVHSQRGRSRCVTILAAYLMKKYRWTCNKSLQYIQARRKDLAVKPGFHRQLLEFERRLAMRVGILSNDWRTIPALKRHSVTDQYDPNEDLILRNTYLNSLGPTCDKNGTAVPTPSKIVWRDNAMANKFKLEQGPTETSIEQKPLKSILKKIPLIRTVKEEPMLRLRLPVSGRISLSCVKSGQSTAESTPVLSSVVPLVRPSTPTRRSELPVRASSPSISLRPASPGRLLGPLSTPTICVSPANRVVRQGRQYIGRPPSPIPSRMERTDFFQERRENIRPPSPIRREPISGGLQSFSSRVSLNQAPRTMSLRGILQPSPAVRPGSAIQFRTR